MPGVERVTVSLSAELVQDIDRRSRNRSKFVAEAVQNEQERRRREALFRSLESPHRDSNPNADQGLADWLTDLPGEDAESLVDSEAGRPVQWVPGEGWAEDSQCG